MNEHLPIGLITEEQSHAIEEYKTYNYDKLCSMITSRNIEFDYLSLKYVLLEKVIVLIKRKLETLQLKKKCTVEIHENQDELINDMKIIINMIEKSAMENIDDPNILGFINIVMFQCSVIFSIHEGIIQPLARRILRHDSKLILNFFKKDIIRTDIITTDIIWTDYVIMKEFLQEDERFDNLIFILDTREEYTIENMKNVNNGIILIKWMEKFYNYVSLIPDYLNRVCYCELVLKTGYADGTCVSSIEFLYHDIEHAKRFLNRCKKRGVNLDKVRDFYIHIKNLYDTKKIRKDIFVPIVVFLYFEIHEGYCYLDNAPTTSIEVMDDYRRLLDPNDLRGLVKIFTEPELKTFFNSGKELYDTKFKEWEELNASHPISLSYGLHPSSNTYEEAKEILKTPSFSYGVHPSSNKRGGRTKRKKRKLRNTAALTKKSLRYEKLSK